MYEALLEIVSREGYEKKNNHRVGMTVTDANSKTWCVDPEQEHTPADKEMYRAILVCSKEILEDCAARHAQWQTAETAVRV